MIDSLEFLQDTLKATSAVTAIEVIEKTIPHTAGDIESLVKTTIQVVIGLIYIYNFFITLKRKK